MIADPGEIITFYSYKGGVGRSMALANVGTLLALRGKKVLLIDCDFEAPGLHRYFPNRVDARATGISEGMIELLGEARDRLSSKTAPPEVVISELLDSGRYNHQVFVREPNGGPITTLSLMPSGRFDDGYPGRVRTFDWAQFYAGHPNFFRAFAEGLGQRFDYVLIDSRTGLTDIGGICTVLLPEKLVLVFTPNEQSMHGALEVGRQAVEQRRASRDLRPLPLFPLMARVENAEYALQNQWIDEARRRFEIMFCSAYGLDGFDLKLYFDAALIPHRSFYSYGELVAAERESTARADSLAAAFDRFVEFLMRDNLLDGQEAMKAQERVAVHGDVERALKEAELAKAEVEQQLKDVQATIARHTKRPWYQVTLPNLASALLVLVSVGAVLWNRLSPKPQPSVAQCIASGLGLKTLDSELVAAVRLLESRTTLQLALDDSKDVISRRTFRLANVASERMLVEACLKPLGETVPRIDARIAVLVQFADREVPPSGVRASVKGQTEASCVTNNEGYCSLTIVDVKPSMHYTLEVADTASSAIGALTLSAAEVGDPPLILLAAPNEYRSVVPSKEDLIIRDGWLESPTLRPERKESPNWNKLVPLEPKFVVLYQTEGRSHQGTIAQMTDPRSKTSGHVLIGRDGSVTQFVPFDKIAYHATSAAIRDGKQINHQGIGLVLTNAGPLIRKNGAWFSEVLNSFMPENEVWRDSPQGRGWQSYPPAQLATLQRVVRALRLQYPSIVELLTQAEILPNKFAPGPAFPLEDFRTKFEAMVRRPDDSAPGPH